ESAGSSRASRGCARRNTRAWKENDAAGCFAAGWMRTSLRFHQQAQIGGNLHRIQRRPDEARQARLGIEQGNPAGVVYAVATVFVHSSLGEHHVERAGELAEGVNVARGSCRRRAEIMRVLGSG